MPLNSLHLQRRCPTQELTDCKLSGQTCGCMFRAQIPQPFDGDGMLATFAFKGGKAFFANRYVRTEGEGSLAAVEAGRDWREGRHGMHALPAGPALMRASTYQPMCQ